MLKNKRMIAVVVLIVAALIGLQVREEARLRKARQLALSEIGKSVDLALTDADVREVNTNGDRWRLVAKSIAYDFKGGVANLDQLEAKITTRDGEAVTVRSEIGLLDSSKDTMLFSQNVELISPDNARLKTQRLLYEGEKKKISTDNDVAIISTTMKLSGRGMEFFLGDKNFKILSGINVEIEK